MVAPNRYNQNPEESSFGIVFRANDGSLCLIDFRDVNRMSIVADEDEFYSDFDYNSIDVVTTVSEDGLLKSWFVITPEEGMSSHKYVAELFLNPNRMSLFTEYLKQALERLSNGMDIPENMSFDLESENYDN